MRKALIAIIALSLFGCTANIRMTDINFEAGHDMRVDASGATNSTDTDQKADGDFSGVAEAAMKWLEGNAGKVMEALKKGQDIVIPVVKDEETFKPADPTEGQGEFEVID